MYKKDFFSNSMIFQFISINRQIEHPWLLSIAKSIAHFETGMGKNVIFPFWILYENDISTIIERP